MAVTFAGRVEEIGKRTIEIGLRTDTRVDLTKWQGTHPGFEGTGQLLAR